jgi:hypothetical protein
MQQQPANPPSQGRSGRTLAELLIGAGLGMALIGFIGPGLISWWYQPPIKDAFSCASSVQAALQQFVWLQLIVALAFAFLTILGSFLVRRRLSKRAQ